MTGGVTDGQTDGQTDGFEITFCRNIILESNLTGVFERVNLLLIYLEVICV